MANQNQIKHALLQIGAIRNKAVDNIEYPKRRYMKTKEKLAALKTGAFRIVKKNENYWYDNVMFEQEEKHEKQHSSALAARSKKIDIIDGHADAARNAIVLGEKPDLIKIIKNLENVLAKIK